MYNSREVIFRYFEASNGNQNMKYIGTSKSTNGKIWKNCNGVKIESGIFLDFSGLLSSSFL